MSVYSVYKFMYYKLYKWNYNAFGKQDLPELNGLLFLSFFPGINIFTLIVAIDYFLGANLLVFINRNQVIKFSLIGSVLIVNFFLLMFRGKHKVIIASFENLKENEKRKPVIITYTYFFASIILLILMLILIATK